MFLTGKKLWDVLERCADLFPAWHKEGNQYWNSNTGEIVRNDGLMLQDAVYRPNNTPDPDGYIGDDIPESRAINFGQNNSGLPVLDQLTTGSLVAEDGNDSLLVDPFSVIGTTQTVFGV